MGLLNLAELDVKEIKAMLNHRTLTASTQAATLVDRTGWPAVWLRGRTAARFWAKVYRIGWVNVPNHDAAP